MNEEEMRLLDIRLAMAFGYKVWKATMYDPNGVLLGGDFSVHIGSVTETKEHVINTWNTYAPRFTKNMNDAMWLLLHSLKEYHLEYNLFSEDDHHTCEFGFFNTGAGERDEVWRATEDTLPIAISKAVAQCPIVMGAWAIPKQPYPDFGKSSKELGIDLYGVVHLSEKSKSILHDMAKTLRPVPESEEES